MPLRWVVNSAVDGKMVWTDKRDERQPLRSPLGSQLLRVHSKYECALSVGCCQGIRQRIRTSEDPASNQSSEFPIMRVMKRYAYS
jgi:hypothetical protein